MRRLLALAVFGGVLTMPGIALAHDAQFGAQLTADQEVPAAAVPADYDGTGTGSVSISDDHSTLTFEVEFAELTGPLTMAHIHYGAAGAAGPPMFWLTDMAVMTGTDSPLAGTLDESDFVPVTDGPQTFAEALAAIEAGDAYVNLHTEANPAGEIRGQLETLPDSATLTEAAPAGLPWTLALVALSLAVLVPVARRFASRIAQP